MDTFEIKCGNAIDVLRTMDAQSVRTCITSPPYFGLRDYGTGSWSGGDPACDHVKGEMRRGLGLADSPASVNGGAHKVATLSDIPYGDVCGKCGATRTDQQLGLEPTPDDFADALVTVFREVRRVLTDDGTVWLNLGDSYAGSSGSGGRSEKQDKARAIGDGVKAKDLIGIPWLVAFALRADGWYLRSDIIWHKPNPMPESVRDRPTSAHEHVFLLSKRKQYYYDADAIRQPHSRDWQGETVGPEYMTAAQGRNDGGKRKGSGSPKGANKRNVWTIAPKPFKGAHFAVFPPKLIEPMILAGSAPGDTVLDPFAGSGTTGIVALEHGRKFVGIDLNSDYCQMARDRISASLPDLAPAA